LSVWVSNAHWNPRFVQVRIELFPESVEIKSPPLTVQKQDARFAKVPLECLHVGHPTIKRP